MSEVIRGGAQAQTEATRQSGTLLARVRAASGIGAGMASPSLSPTQAEDLFNEVYGALSLQFGLTSLMHEALLRAREEIRFLQDKANTSVGDSTVEFIDDVLRKAEGAE